MVKITENGLDLALPEERNDPYNWGGEGDFGETNPIRNYVTACRDAQEAAPYGPRDEVPTHDDWQRQIDAARTFADAFDELDERGRPATIPAEIYDLYDDLSVERPDLQFAIEPEHAAPVTRPPTGQYNYALRIRALEAETLLSIRRRDYAVVDGDVTELAPAERYYQVGIDRTSNGEIATHPSSDWGRAEDMIRDAALEEPGPYQGGRYAGVPEASVVTVDTDGAAHIREASEVSLDLIQAEADAELVQVVELAKDLDMWVDEESAHTQEPNPTATKVASRFGVDHCRYQGPAVFTGGADSEGNSLPLNRSQAVVIRDAAISSANQDLWHVCCDDDLNSTFQTRANQGLPNTNEQMTQQQVALQALRADPHGPIVNGPGVN